MLFWCRAGGGPGGLEFAARGFEVGAEVGVGVEGVEEVGGEGPAGGDVGGEVHAGDDAVEAELLAAGEERVLEIGEQVGEDHGVHGGAGAVAGGITGIGFVEEGFDAVLRVGVGGARAVEKLLGGVVGGVGEEVDFLEEGGGFGEFFGGEPGADDGGEGVHREDVAIAGAGDLLGGAGLLELEHEGEFGLDFFGAHGGRGGHEAGELQGGRRRGGVGGEAGKGGEEEEVARLHRGLLLTMRA